MTWASRGVLGRWVRSGSPRWPPSCATLRGPRGPAAARPGRRGGAGARPGHRGGRAAGADPATARADLDAFADAAAAFAGDQEEPTLGAFLAYLAAAEEEEFGLEAGRVGDGDAVKLVTVHAAKGLQWAAVVVPGLSAGKRAQVFPARPRLTHALDRQSAAGSVRLAGGCRDLPGLPVLTHGTLARFVRRRRAGRVSSARSAGWPTWPRPGPRSGWAAPVTGGGTRRRRSGPSVFLAEVRAACEAGAGTVARGPPSRPRTRRTRCWPSRSRPAGLRTPAGPRQEAVRQAADLVQAALAGRRAAGAAPGEGPGDPAGGAGAERRGPRPGRGLAAGHRRCCSPSGRSGAARRPGRSGCRRGCRCPRWW